MKITKKQPLRPRGRSEEKRQSTKNAIRDAYINGPQKEVQIIPAKRDTVANVNERMVLRYRYIHNMTWEQIGGELNADESTIRRWHKAALSAVVLPTDPIRI